MASSNLVLRTVYLSPSVDDKLRDEAYFTRTSKNDLIRRYIEAGMQVLSSQNAATKTAAKKSAPAKKGVAFAGKNATAAKKTYSFTAKNAVPAKKSAGLAAKKAAPAKKSATAKKTPAKKAMSMKHA